MSLDLLNQIILRVVVDPNFITKADTLTFVEEDTNFQIIADAIRELANASISGLDAFDPMLEYTAPDFVSYDGNIYEYINVDPQTGIVPGTDPSTWELSSAGAFAHQQNTDTKLAEGTANEVSAAELRTLIDSTFPSKVTDSDNIDLLIDEANWDDLTGEYTGAVIAGQLAGDWYTTPVGAETRYRYYFDTPTDPIRIAFIRQ